MAAPVVFPAESCRPQHQPFRLQSPDRWYVRRCSHRDPSGRHSM